jgi:hypothetical protein
MKFGHKGHFNIKNKLPKKIFFSNSKIFLPILDELKNLGFGGRGEIHEIKEARAMNSLQGWR